MFMSACACVYTIPHPYPNLSVSLSEPRVWVDIMPGAKERGYALWNAAISNDTDTPITIIAVAGAVCDTLDRIPFRRFECSFELDGQMRTSLDVPPGASFNLLIKSKAGFEPFDVKRYPSVRSHVAFTVSTGEPLIVESAVIPVLVTQ